MTGRSVFAHVRRTGRKRRRAYTIVDVRVVREDTFGRSHMPRKTWRGRVEATASRPGFIVEGRTALDGIPWNWVEVQDDQDE